MSNLHISEMDAIAARHPTIFERSLWSRFRTPLLIGLMLVYAVYCWWFIAIG